jgi:hypothetical protein
MLYLHSWSRYMYLVIFAQISPNIFDKLVEKFALFNYSLSLHIKQICCQLLKRFVW